MSSRAKRAPSLDDEGNENPAKRQPVNDDEREAASTIIEDSLSLTGLEESCLLYMMSKLHHRDLNSLSMVNLQFCELRDHESLDQKRTPTIICRVGSTMQSFINYCAENDLDYQFVGNLTELKIEHVERIATEELETSRDNALLVICNYCKRLRKVTWNGSRYGVYLDGSSLVYGYGITELYADECCFDKTIMDLGVDDTFEMTDARFYMFHRSRNLERVSVKNATFGSVDEDNPSPVTQEMLIKLARCSPKLQWLRSDLTAENIAMLKREKPGITFVSE